MAGVAVIEIYSMCSIFIVNNAEILEFINVF